MDQNKLESQMFTCSQGYLVFNLLTLSVSTEGFQSIDIERIYWRFSIYWHWAYLLKVFQKRVVHTKYDIHVFVKY
jgi:hypothetical protein